jgi:N-acetylated-alpha-linked acidic dipeptidase
MRLADAEVLPFEFTDFADTIQKYTKELKKLLADKQEDIRERNKELEEGVFKATLDPRRPTVAPPKEEMPPFLNFAPLDNAADALVHSAEHYHQAVLRKQGEFGGMDAALLNSLNEKLIESERKLTSEEGLPRRPWYKHLLYAPGVYSGYDVKTIPGVREGIELKRYDEAEKEIARVAKALLDESALIESAAQELK